MLTIIIVALISLFVGVIATAYYLESKFRKDEASNNALVTTGLEKVYDLGYDCGYKQGGQDAYDFVNIMSKSN